MVEIVAEISGNHGGDLGKALGLIVEAAACGCDYVKFQLYHPKDMPDYLEYWEMYEKLSVPDEWLPEMFLQAHQCHIGLFASVFSVRAAKELLKYDVPYIKFASPKSTELPVETYYNILKIVPADAEIIASADNADFYAAVPKVLYCPEGHPPTINTENFSEFRRGNYWGFSDHTKGIRTPMAFIRAGAQMIEKHFKLEYDHLTYEKLPVDNSFSADPNTMKLLCRLAHNYR